MKQGKKSRIWVILSVLLSILLILAIVGTGVANYFSRSINMYFNLDTYKLVKSGDEQDAEYFPKEYESVEEMVASDLEVCERVEGEGAVLMKNDGVLPLEAGDVVSTFSHSSVDLVYGGTGSGDVEVTEDTPTLYSALSDAGLIVNDALWDFYKSGNGSGEDYTRVMGKMSATSAGETTFALNEVPWSLIEEENGLIDTFNGTTALVMISRIGGEGMDLPNGRTTTTTCINTRTGEPENATGDYLTLGDDEAELLMQLKNLKDNGVLNGIVVLLNTSNAIQADFLTNPDYGVDAALWIGGVGEQGINAVGDIIAGNVNPSGRLADTYVNDNWSAPATVNAGTRMWANASEFADLDMEAEAYYTLYLEGIYVGYLYYETRYEDYVMGTGNAGDYNYAGDVAYPFGYGMSYTTFRYDNMSVEKIEDNYVVKVDVTNTGDRAGKEVVEVYLQSPYTDYDRENGIEKASVRLCGYNKTEILEPGATETVTVEIPETEMASYDSNGAETYIMDAGTYYLGLGNGAHEAVNNILAAKGYSPANTDNRMDSEGNAELVYSFENESLDTETFSVSSHTGHEITNEFDSADLNRFEASSQSVTYLTRNDWEGTMPVEPTELELTEEYLDIMHSFEEYETDPEAEMPVFGKNSGMTLAMMIGKEYDDPAWETLLDQITKDEMINLVGNAMHTTAPIASIAKPQTVDENGPSGLNQVFFGGQINSTSYPCAVVLASTFNDKLIEEVGQHIGENGLHCGVEGLYGPAMNIHRTPHAGRNFEYYSEDGVLSGGIAASFTRGVQSKGMYVYTKHLVLCDSESRRYGNSIWSNEQAIREIYLKAFEEAMAIDGANAHATMTSHTRFGGIWCGQNVNLLQNVVRDEWGFDGFVITDMDIGTMVAQGKGDTIFMAAPKTIICGTDCYDSQAAAERMEQLRAVSDDPTVMQALRQASHRILYTVANSAAMNGIGPNDTIEIVHTWWQYALIALDVVLALLTGFCIFMAVKKKKNKKQA